MSHGGDVLCALVHHVFDFHDGPPNRTFRPTAPLLLRRTGQTFNGGPKRRCGAPLLRRLRKHLANNSVRTRREIGDLTAYILSLRNPPERANP